MKIKTNYIGEVEIEVLPLTIFIGNNELLKRDMVVCVKTQIQSSEKNYVYGYENPEKDLSPTKQILMARNIASFVNAGHKVIMTTNSDYIIKEFNVLLMLGGNAIPAEYKISLESLKGRSGLKDCDEFFLHPRSIAVYTIGDLDGVERCEQDGLGVITPFFDDVIDWQNNYANSIALMITDEPVC